MIITAGSCGLASTVRNVSSVFCELFIFCCFFAASFVIKLMDGLSPLSSPLYAFVCFRILFLLRWSVRIIRHDMCLDGDGAKESRRIGITNGFNAIWIESLLSLVRRTTETWINFRKSIFCESLVVSLSVSSAFRAIWSENLCWKTAFSVFLVFRISSSSGIPLARSLISSLSSTSSLRTIFLCRIARLSFLGSVASHFQAIIHIYRL